ncbi:hypothetical protein P4613_05155 [Halalkalibacterium halodurans]|nr:hypothetical protein [Halalkalibacterium halodurans]
MTLLSSLHVVNEGIFWADRKSCLLDVKEKHEKQKGILYNKYIIYV